MTTSNRRIALLTGASFGAIGMSMLAAAPAQAACVLTGTALVCGNTTTTDTVYPANVPNDRGYAFNTADTITVTAGTVVDGFGLAFGGFFPTGYTVTNNGTIQVNAGNTPALFTPGANAALNLYQVGGDGNITYTGTGSIINLGTGEGLGIDLANASGATATIGGSVRAENGDAIHVDNSGSGAVALTTTAGQTVRSSGGDGIEVVTTGTGNTTITNAAAISRGVTASTLQNGIIVTNSGTAGNIAIANTGAIGTTTDRAQLTGITAAITNPASAGTISVTGTGAIASVGNGIDASTLGTGTVTVNYTGAINTTTGDGIQADSTTGNLSVTSGAITAAAGDGIQTTTTTGNTAITVGGTVSAAGAANRGIRATSTSGTIGVTVGVASGTTFTGNVINNTSGATAIDLASTGNKTVTILSGRQVSAGTTTAPGVPGTSILATGGGTLTVTNSGILGLAGGVAVDTDATTVATITNNASGTLRGRVLLSDGNDTVNNAGTWTMGGASDFGAGTDVINNTGTINAATGTTLANLETLNNNSTGIFNANGTLGFTGVATAVNNSGTFNVNNGVVTGIGTLTNSGTLDLDGTSTLTATTYTQTAAGTVIFQVDGSTQGTATPGTYPQIFATTANLDGTLSLRAVNQTTGLIDTSFYDNVIDATTRNGTFDSCGLIGIPGDSVLIGVTCEYDTAANVDVRVIRTAFDAVDGLNQNAIGVGGGLKSIFDPDFDGDLAAVFADLLLITDPAEYNDALNQLSGVQYASYLQSFTSLGVHYNDLLDKATSCEVPALAGSVLECRTAPLHLWGQVDFQNRRVDGDVEAGGSNGDRWSMLIGFDANVAPSTIIGASFGRVTNRIDFNDYDSFAKADGYQVGLYGVYDPGAFYAKLIGTWSRFDGDLERRLNFVPFGGATEIIFNGDPDVQMWTLGGHFGYRMAMGANSALTPYVNVDYTRAKMERFWEQGFNPLEIQTGTGAELLVRNSKESRTTVTGGIKWAGDMGGVVPELNVGYRYTFGDRRSNFRANFYNESETDDVLVFGDDFTIVSEAERRGGFLAGLSLGGMAGPVDVRVGYEGLFNGTSTSHAGNFKIVLPLGARAVAPPPVVEVAPPPPPPVVEPVVEQPAPPPPPPPAEGERG